MSGIRIVIIGEPIGDRRLTWRLNAEPADLLPGEIALVLRQLAGQLDPTTEAGS